MSRDAWSASRGAWSGEIRRAFSERLIHYRTLRFVRGVGYIWRGGGVVGVVRVGEWRLGAGYAKDGKRLSGEQEIRWQGIRTAGYQVKEHKVDG